MEYRTEALSWWRALSLTEQWYMVKKHCKPNTDWITVARSSSKIEEMYVKESEK